MAAEQFALQVWFTKMCDCVVCGVPIVAPTNKEQTLRNKGGSFFCINGHSQSFTETENMRLKRELEEQKAQTERQREARAAAEKREETAKRSAAAFKGQVTDIKARVGRGVCPCCNRTFQNLMRHMHTKHPEFKSDEK